MWVFDWEPEQVPDLSPRTIVYFALVPEPVPVPSGHVVRVPMPPVEEAVTTGMGAHRPVEAAISLRFWQAAAVSGLDGRALEMLDRAVRQVVPTPLLPDRDAVVAAAAREDPSALDTYRTVVELRADVRVLSETSILATFGRAVEALQQFDRGLRVARRAQSFPLTLERLHQMVFFATLAGRHGWDRRTGWVVAHRRLPHILAPEPVGRERLVQIDAHVDAIRRGHPYLLHLERLLPAYAAFDVGDYEGATLASAIAIEILIDSALSLALWDGGAAPDEAARRLDGPIVQRVRRRLPAAFEEPRSLWSPDGPGPAGRWKRDLVDLRNAVVHRGHLPGRSETVQAVEAAELMSKLVRSRMLAASDRMPRAALTLLGPGPLQREGRWSPRLQAVSHLDWLDTFNAWRDQVDEAAERRRGRS